MSSGSCTKLFLLRSHTSRSLLSFGKMPAGIKAMSLDERSRTLRPG